MDKTDMKGLLCHVRKLGLFPAGYGALTGGCKQGCEVIVALFKDRLKYYSSCRSPYNTRSTRDKACKVQQDGVPNVEVLVGKQSPD